MVQITYLLRRDMRDVEDGEISPNIVKQMAICFVDTAQIIEMARIPDKCRIFTFIEVCANLPTLSKRISQVTIFYSDVSLAWGLNVAFAWVSPFPGSGRSSW